MARQASAKYKKKTKTFYLLSIISLYKRAITILCTTKLMAYSNNALL